MARLNGARLLMLEKDNDKVVREVPVRTGQVQIGSNPMLNNMIRLNSAGVEPIHCKIFVKNERVFIANYSTANPISVDNTVVPKRAALRDGSILEICGTRFRWKFDESKLAAAGRPEKAKKTEQTPTSSKLGNRRRTTMVRKKQPVAAAAAAVGGSGKKPAAKKAAQQNRTPTYTLPKNHKQLLKNIRKRFTVHNIITRHNSEDGADEEDVDCEESALPEVAESPKPATPQKVPSTTSSAANTPFYTPEPEKENSVPVTKTPKTPLLQLESSAMMILSYTPAIGSRSKANIQKTPISVAKSAQRLNYLTPKNENVSANATPLKSKAGNSMYLIDLTTPNSGHSSFVCSPMLDTSASSVDSPKLRLIDLTTPSPKMTKTPASVLKSAQQKTLLKSALKNASRTPRTALRTATGTPVTPKAVPKISLNDTPTKSAVSTRSNRTPASGSKGSSIRSKLETPISSKKVDSARKQTAPATPTVAQPESTPQKEVPIMTTDELFDTLVGRQSNVKTYERKSTSPKKTPCPLVLAEDTSELPKTDIDLWVESVIAASTSPEPVHMEAIIRKPNQTTQVRSSQYSDITPHESFADSAGTSEVVEPQPEVLPVSSPDELDNMTDMPTIPNSGRRSDTPLASKIARSLGNKRQTIGNFFTNIFGKLTVSPVTRISIADDSLNQSEPNGDDSDGSEEVYHDSETNQGGDETPPESAAALSPKLRQSLRDTRKFIGNAWTSLNTSRPQLDQTAEIDESLLLSDTYNESRTDAGNNTAAGNEDYDLTDLGSRPATALPPASATKTPTTRRSAQPEEAFDISPLATPLESTPNGKERPPPQQDLERDAETGSFVISPDVNTLPPGTPISRRSSQVSTPSRRSTRRLTDPPPADSVGSTVNSPVVQMEEVEQVIVEEQTVYDQLEQSICNSPNQSLDANVENELVADDEPPAASDLVEEHAAEEPPQNVPVEDEPQMIDEIRSEEHPTSIAISANSTALDTSEMEPLEVTEGHESECEVVQPATPPSKDLVGSRRATRNSIATLKVVTPKSASPVAKAPMSESKLPLRGLRTSGVVSAQEVDLDVTDKQNYAVDPIEETGVESVFEQSNEIDKSMTSCDDQAEVAIAEAHFNEITTSDEVSPSDGHVAAALESSQIADNSTVHLAVTARRSNRKTLATMVTTPQRTSAPVKNVPMSESKLPLRGLQKTMVEADEKSPEKPSGEDSAREVEMMEDSVVGKEDIVEVENVVEQSISIDKLMTSSDDQVEITNAESKLDEITTREEEDLVTSSHTTVGPDSETVEDAVGHNPATNLETSILNVAARRSTRQSMPTTPKMTASPLGMVPMSESKLPLRRLRATETSILEQTVEESQADEVSKLEDDVSIVANAEQLSVTLEESGTESVTIDTTSTKEPNQSMQSTPVPASPARPSRSSARSTPQKVTSTPTSKATPSTTAPLLKRVLQKVATKAVVTQSPKPNDSTSDASLQLDQLYRTPTQRVTRGHVAATSTPNVADESLKLDELYKTPARVTRGNGTPAGKSNESLASSSLHLDNLYGTPVSSVAAQEDSEITVEDKLELIATPEKALRDESHLSEVTETSMENASLKVEADMGLGRQQTPARSDPEQPMKAESPKEAETSLNLHELYKTPARTLQAQQSQDAGTPNESLNLQHLYKTPAARHSAVVKSTPKSTAELQPNADMSLNLQELYKTPARPTRSAAVASTSKSTPKVADVSKVEESQPDVSLNLQELYKTPARTLRVNTQKSAVKNFETPKEEIADASLNLQEMYKTPARPTRSAAVASTSKDTPKAAVDTDLSKVEESQPDVSLNLQELYKTPARTLRGNAQQSATNNLEMHKEESADVSLNLQEMYKTPARPTRSASLASASKNTPKVTDVSKVEESHPDVSLNLQELYKTPARTLQQSDTKNLKTPKEESADVSLNLQEMYKTPARPSRSAALASASKNTPKVTDVSKLVESQPDVSLNLQELYKTPARTLRGVSQLTPSNAAKVSTPAVAPVQREPEADVSLNLDQLYKTPARQLRGTTQAVKHVTLSEVTPQKVVDKSAKDVTPTAEPSKVQRTPIASVSEPEANMTLNLDQMYKTPARQSSAEEKVEADATLNLDQLYKTPAHSLPGVTQLTVAQATPATEAKSEAEIQQNSTTQADKSNVEPLFKTPARTTRARLPHSSAKVNATPAAKTPSRTPRSASKILATPAVNTSVTEPSMVESELASSLVEESLNLGSESDGLPTGKAVSSTPFNPRTRKSTLVATVGMMSPLNSSVDETMTFTSQMHTEAIGITTIQDKSAAADSTTTTTVDQMQTLAGVFVEAQSRLLYDESALQTTMQGDPLQVTNAVEPLADTQLEGSTCVEDVTATQLNETTAVESLLEQNETLVKSSSFERAVPEGSLVSNTAEEPETNASLNLEQSSSSPARASRSLRSVAGTPVNKSAVEPAMNISLNLPETPARMPQSAKSTPQNTPAAVQSLIASPKGFASRVVKLTSPAAVQSPVASPKVSTTPASSAKKSASETPKSTPTRLSIANTSAASKPPSASKTRRSVNDSVNEQKLVPVPDELVESVDEPSSADVENKLVENVPDESVEPTDEIATEKSVSNLSVPESTPVEETINDVTPEVEEPIVAAAPYLDVDEALLLQIRERVTTLERELEEIDNVTHGSSTFLERSDDSQEVSEVESKLENKTPKPKKRQLYTKIAPDDSTPERRESIDDHRATSSRNVYLETPVTSDKKADTSSEAEESKKVEQPVKVLPSRASRRKITTLSEEALAGASPELKFVKPKPPKVIPTEGTPSINTSANTSETETSDQETSLGRRKVAFNDHIQVKEINSPAFVGEIIKKTTQRGRGRNTKQVVTVTVDQNLGQSIKPATKRGKPVETEEVPVQDAESVSDKVETVEAEQNPGQAGTVAGNDEDISEQQSEEITEAVDHDPATKQSRSKKVAPAAKRTASRTEADDQSSTGKETEAVAKPTAKRSRRGRAKTEAEPFDEPLANNDEEVVEDANESSQKSEETVEVTVDEPTTKRSRSRKAPATKRTASKPKVDEQTSISGAITAPAEVFETAKEATDEPNVEVEQKVNEPEPNADEEVAQDAKESSEQTDVEEPTTKRSRPKKAPATKRTASKTKVEEQTSQNESETAKPTAKRSRRGAKIDASDVAEAVQDAEPEHTVNEQTSTNEGNADEHETVATKPTAKRSRRGANVDSSDVTEAAAKQGVSEQKIAEVVQTVDEPISKRIRHAPETSTDSTVEKPIDDQVDETVEPEQTDEVKPAAKAPSRSRRGKKQAEAPLKTDDVQTEPDASSAAEAQATDQASKTKEVKLRSRRGGKKNDTPAEEVVQTESTDGTPMEDLATTDTTTQAAEEKTDDSKAKSRRDAKRKPVETKVQEPSQVEEKIQETTETKEETKPRSRRGGAKGKTTDEVESAPVEIQTTEDAKQPTKSRRAAKKQATEDESIAKESEKVPSSADSHEEKSNAKRQPAAKKTSRKGRGAAKDDTVESSEQPASAVVEKAVADSTSHDDPSATEVDAKSNTKRSRRGAKDESEAAEAKDEPTTKRSRRGAPKSKAEQVSGEDHAESVDVTEEPKPASRSRRGQKVEDESQHEATIEQQEPSEIEDKPASRRGAKKIAEEHLPSPAPPPAIDEQPAKRTGRQAAKRAPKKASNPDPAPVEMSMNESHMVKTVLPASHTSTPLIKTAANADVEAPSATRGRRAANPVIAALIEESTPSTRTRRGASATPTVQEVETPSTPARRGRGRGAAAKAPQPETEPVAEAEPEPVAKRARKVPAKLRDETDDDLGAKKAQPTRGGGRRGAKAKTTLESKTADEDDGTVEVSAGPSEEQPKKGRAAAKRTVKKADLNEESVPVEEEAEEKKAPKSPPPKRTRKGAR